jgi:hypothetical protein
MTISGNRWWRALAVACLVGATIGSASAAPSVDLATDFGRVADATAGQPEPARVAAIRATMDARLPGIYPTGAATDRRIAAALAAFPAVRERYAAEVAAFPGQLEEAIARFRVVFPGFASPLPIYLYHSLGARDGGSEYLEPGHRHVMLFGADMIAALHADDSVGPFFDHELFHLQHARAFADCDQLWCGLWQEGLAVHAAATMTPGATDHQLLLDLPVPLRAATDARWAAALCFVAAHFDDTDAATIAQALVGRAGAPDGLPDRFGYYVGYRLAREAGSSLPTLARLGHRPARRLVRRTLVAALADAHASCPAPPAQAPITSHTPHAV